MLGEAGQLIIAVVVVQKGSEVGYSNGCNGSCNSNL